MMTEYVETVKFYWKFSYGSYIVIIVDDAGLESEVKKVNTMPLHLGVFVFLNCE